MLIVIILLSRKPDYKEPDESEVNQTSAHTEPNSSDLTPQSELDPSTSNSLSNTDSNETIYSKNIQTKTNIFDTKENQTILKNIFKAKLSGSTISVTSSEEKGSPEESASSSRCTTPSTSHESKMSRPRGSRFTTVSPFAGTSNNNIIIAKDELLRCDHRLKLHFAMDLFQEEGEDFSCILKVRFLNIGRTMFKPELMLS